MNGPVAYTPEQAAEFLQLSKNTIYELINRGEIVAKRLGRVYRIPRASLSFVFTGLDDDLLRAELADGRNLDKVERELDLARKKL